jgi:hypothetical protein
MRDRFERKETTRNENILKACIKVLEKINWFLETSSKGLVLECNIGLVNELTVAFVRLIVLSCNTKSSSFRKHREANLILPATALYSA